MELTEVRLEMQGLSEGLPSIPQGLEACAGLPWCLGRFPIQKHTLSSSSRFNFLEAHKLCRDLSVRAGVEEQMLLWFGTEALRLEEVSGCACLSPVPAGPWDVLMYCRLERT